MLGDISIKWNMQSHEKINLDKTFQSGEKARVFKNGFS